MLVWKSPSWPGGKTDVNPANISTILRARSQPASSRLSTTQAALPGCRQAVSCWSPVRAASLATCKQGEQVSHCSAFALWKFEFWHQEGRFPWKNLKPNTGGCVLGQWASECPAQSQTNAADYLSASWSWTAEGWDLAGSGWCTIATSATWALPAVPSHWEGWGQS